MGAISTASACSIGVSKYQEGRAVPISIVGKKIFAAASRPKDKPINKSQPAINKIIEIVLISNMSESHMHTALNKAVIKRAIIVWLEVCLRSGFKVPILKKPLAMAIINNT